MVAVSSSRPEAALASKVDDNDYMLTARYSKETTQDVSGNRYGDTNGRSRETRQDKSLL